MNGGKMSDAHPWTDPDRDIVVGVDGSQESFAALRWALREASLTSRRVNAVYGWTRSWQMGPEPHDDAGWAKARAQISAQLRQWADTASQGLKSSRDSLTLTSVHASGTSALLELGSNAQQIVVGRRSLGPVARWLTGSLSSSLAEEAQVPVTIVKTPSDEISSVRAMIARTLRTSSVSRKPDGIPANPGDGSPDSGTGISIDTADTDPSKPIVVGVDGSTTSLRALDFASDMAATHHRPLRIMMCWQLRDLGTIPGYERAVAPLDEVQRYVQGKVDEIATHAHAARDCDVQAYAFHIPAAQGLIDASRYASHIVVGTRGLNGINAHFLGSVSRRIVDLSECSATIVH